MEGAMFYDGGALVAEVQPGFLQMSKMESID